jgi:hypothetical protein
MRKIEQEKHGVAEDRAGKEARTPRTNPLHQIEIDDFRRDRLLAALALLFGAASSPSPWCRCSNGSSGAACRRGSRLSFRSPPF